MLDAELLKCRYLGYQPSSKFMLVYPIFRQATHMYLYILVDICSIYSSPVVDLIIGRDYNASKP
jgi:hypothetical protein